MSREAFLALPEEKPALEYWDGVVRQKTMADAAHRRLTGRIDIQFGAFCETHGGDFGPEGRVRVGPRFLVPDTAYWLPGIPSGDDTLPTVVVEVRSPDETMRTQRAKCRFYREAGVPVAWLVDPVSRTIEVFEGDVDGLVRPAGDVITTPLMPGFALDVDRLFSVLGRG
jgi:Uma2 family endonuclease